MKSGRVALVGRPNAGKSTLINALVGRKISIVTDKPQTTRKVVHGLYWDQRGQIIFSDTPGIFAKISGPVGKKIAQLTPEEIKSVDLVVYLIDHCRSRGQEENRILGLVRKFNGPKILAINKIDIKRPDHLAEYLFLKEEFDDYLEISALQKTHLKTLLEKIFNFLPEAEKLFEPANFYAFPALNLKPKEFIGEIIREKAFMTLRAEIPYSIGVDVQKIEESDKMFRIAANLITDSARYKPIIIGKNGRYIKEIGVLARKEIELITNKKVYLELKVMVDKHWARTIPGL